MTARSLDTIRPCLEGIIPAMIATCAQDGTPNVAYLSQVYYVDANHVALSFQFFNKTRQNILANPSATLLLLHPETFAFYRLHIRYLETHTSGAIFESMRAQLAGIASHSGMADVFELKGSDLYEVLAIEDVPGEALPGPTPRNSLLTQVRRASESLARSTSLTDALEQFMTALATELSIEHAMVLLLDPVSQRLYTVASHGYPNSGVGSEIALGQGVIGVAARERTPVRITHMTNASLYSHAVKLSLAHDSSTLPEMEIPYPGLTEPQSQMALPILSANRLLGVLFVESPEALRFTYEDEDAFAALSAHLGAVIDLLRLSSDEVPDSPLSQQPSEPPASTQELVHVRRYRSNNSIFLNDAYLIKGVAGSIFWKLLNSYIQHGRTEFSNRELRLDAGIGLPEVVDNLEARLILLERRLSEQALPLRMVKIGRGRFKLCIGLRIELIESD